MTGNPFDSPNNLAFFIAEIGGNHEGDFSYAMRLCDLAIESGADAVKFQLYRGDRLVSSLSSPDRVAHFRKFELTREQHIEIAKRVRAAGLHYMASVWDDEMFSWIDPYIEIHKVGSGDLTCYPMLKALAATGKPIILSTGLANPTEIRKAIDFIADVDGSYLPARKLALLQCTSAYPTPDDAANLRVIPALAKEFGLPVGYSDHTPGSGALDLAYALGARIFEKHFTDTREGKTFRDHSISLTCSEVQEALEGLRRAETLLGSDEKSLTEEERGAGHHISFRRGLYAGTRIAAGSKLTEENVVALRPCTGIPADRYYHILGRTSVRAVEALTPIGEDDLVPEKQDTVRNRA